MSFRSIGTRHNTAANTTVGDRRRCYRRRWRPPKRVTIRPAAAATTVTVTVLTRLRVTAATGRGIITGTRRCKRQIPQDRIIIMRAAITIIPTVGLTRPARENRRNSIIRITIRIFNTRVSRFTKRNIIVTRFLVAIFCFFFCFFITTEKSKKKRVLISK